jgi:hypothetical protein
MVARVNLCAVSDAVVVVFPGGVFRKMKKLVHFALAVIFTQGLVAAQHVPVITAFGGYSYLNFNVPSNDITQFASQQLSFNGYEFGGSVALLRGLGAEFNVAGHSLSNCGDTGENCTNFQYFVGPRYDITIPNTKITGFVHALIGQDRMTLPVAAGGTQSDTTVAFGGGGGIDYWVYPHIGVQLGPIDYIYTHHLNSENVPSQTAYRIAVGVAFRFGGDINEQPKPASESKSHRGGKNQPPATVVYQPPPATMTARGMSIPALGVVVAPQEFDGAKIVDVTSGGVAQMASLKPGDLIRSVDGKVVKTPMELAAELSDKTGKVRLGILRGDVAAETTVLLGH